MSTAQCRTTTTYETRRWYESSVLRAPMFEGASGDDPRNASWSDYPFDPRKIEAGVVLPRDDQKAAFAVKANEFVSQRAARQELGLRQEMMQRGRALTEEELGWLRQPPDDEEDNPLANEVYSVDVPDVFCHAYFFGLGREECTTMGTERIAVYVDLSTSCTYVAGITPLPPPEELAAIGLERAIDPSASSIIEAADLALLQQTLEEIASLAGDGTAVEYEDIMAYGEDPLHPLHLEAYRLTVDNGEGSFEAPDERLQIKMGLWRAIEASALSAGGKQAAKAMLAGDPRIVAGPSGEGSYTGDVILENATGLLRLGRTDDAVDVAIAIALGTGAVELFSRSEPAHPDRNGRIEYFQQL